MNFSSFREYNVVQDYWYYILSALIVLTSFYCFSFNIIDSGRIGEYTNITKPLDMNPNFFAIPVILVLLFFSWEWLEKSLSQVGRIVRAGIGFSCLCTLILLTSRMAFFALFFSLITLGIYYSYQRRNFKPFFVLASLLTIVIITLSRTHLGGIRFRNIKIHLNAVLDDPMKINRIQTMDAGIDLMIENIWFGVGFDDMQPKLEQIYRNKGYKYALNQKYHIHNQFIQIGAFGGIFLLLLCTIFMWLPVILNFQIFGFLQSSVFTLVFLTDSPLMDVRIAIVFVLTCGVLWWPIFFNKRKVNKDDN